MTLHLLSGTGIHHARQPAACLPDEELGLGIQTYYCRNYTAVHGAEFILRQLISLGSLSLDYLVLLFTWAHMHIFICLFIHLFVNDRVAIGLPQSGLQSIKKHAKYKIHIQHSPLIQQPKLKSLLKDLCLHLGTQSGQ